MAPQHDREARRTVPLAAGSAITPDAEVVLVGGGRARLSTGALLTELGERVARPAVPTVVALDPDGLPPEAARLLGTLASVDPEEPARSHALARYATAMARALAPVAEGARIHQAALLCNIGLVAIPQEIVQRTAVLTSDEQRMIRRHPNPRGRIAARARCPDGLHPAGAAPSQGL